jgi:hypothetical protein
VFSSALQLEILQQIIEHPASSEETLLGVVNYPSDENSFIIITKFWQRSLEDFANFLLKQNCKLDLGIFYCFAADFFLAITPSDLC